MKIGKLVTFFHGITVFVDSICESQVKKFDRDVKMIAESLDGPSVLKYNAFLRDGIFQLTLQIHAQFELFKDITGMYRTVHAQCITEGLELVGKCAVPPVKPVANMNDAELAAHHTFLEDRRKEMSTYTKKASDTIRSIVEEKQNAIISGIEKRVAEIEAQIEEFPIELQKPSEAKMKAITNGTEIASNQSKEQVYSESSGVPAMKSSFTVSSTLRFSIERMTNTSAVR